MRSFLNFVKYNNTFPLLLVAVLLIGGAVFAANPEVRQALVAGTPAALVTDLTPLPAPNSTLLRETDISQFDFGFTINAVRQDEGAYSIDYFYRTLEVADNVWVPISHSKTLDVPKALLGQRDLGLYAADQIGQVMDRERAYLGEVQERLQSTDPATGGAKQYAGLVGKELTTAGELDGYEPVVKPPKVTATKKASNSNENNANSLTVELPGNGPVVQSLLSKVEIRDLIVQAVSDFLAIEAPAPAPVVPGTESTDADNQNQTEIPDSAADVATDSDASDLPVEATDTPEP